MNLTKKESTMLSIIEQYYTTAPFGITEIKQYDTSSSVAVLANLSKKGILVKIGEKPATYQYVNLEDRKEPEQVAPNEANKVIELETGIIFDSSANAYAIKGEGYSKIKDAVGGRRRVAGGSHWCRLSDMPINFTVEDCLQKIEIIDLSFGYIEGRKINRGKRVRCVETGQEFYSASEASRFYNLSTDAVAAACRGDIQTAGGYHWEYVEEDA